MDPATVVYLTGIAVGSGAAAVVAAISSPDSTKTHPPQSQSERIDRPREIFSRGESLAQTQSRTPK